MPAPLPPHAVPWPEDHIPTDFQREVIGAVSTLEAGELVTYSEIADELGRPGAGQAVANVLRRAPDLPWWRVLPADGRLYCSHIPVQAPLLEAEGHTIDENRRVISPSAAPGPGERGTRSAPAAARRAAPGRSRRSLPR